MQDLERDSGLGCQWSTRIATVVGLLALVISPTLVKAQRILPDLQAEKRAESLIGKKPDRVDTYFSKEENTRYFAFAIRTASKWDAATSTQLHAREQIWIYKQGHGSKVVNLVWKTSRLWADFYPQEYSLPDGFVKLSAEAEPCLRLSDSSSGNEANTTRLGLYCVGERRLFWVDFFSDYRPSVETGVEHVVVSDNNADYLPVRQYLHSWGHQLRLDVPPSFPKIDAVRRVQQQWIDANGRKACSYQRTAPYGWLGWKSDQTDKLTPYATRRLLKNPQVVLAYGRYEWLSYPGADSDADVGTALAGIGRYDKQLHRFDLVYVPDSSFDYSRKLVLLGRWLYIQDCGKQWAVRYNTLTHRLQRGNFDGIVGKLTTGIYPARSNPSSPVAPQSQTEQPASIVVRAYEVVRNPFAHEGKRVDLVPWQWPILYNGQTYSWSHGANSQLGYVGLRFNRMLEPQTAVFDVMAQDMSAPEELESVGQIIVILPPDVSKLDVMRTWVVVPLGTTEGTNYLGAVIRVPTVRFLKYIGK